MKTLKWIFIALSALVISGACSSSGDDTPEGALVGVSSQLSANNLRVNITPQFNGAAQYRIEYWKATEPGNVKTTQTYSTSGSNHTATLVFLEPRTEYAYRVVYGNTAGATNTFTTGSLPGDMPMFTLETGEQANIPGYILFDKAEPVLDNGCYIIVTDTKGTVVWYEPIPRGVKVVNFDERTNTFTALTGANGATSNDKMAKYTAEYLLVIDIFGNTILRKDVRDLYLHHDARMLPNGDLAALSFFSRNFDLTAIGGSADATVIGDGFTVIGIDGTVKKQWDFFEEGRLDPSLDPNVVTEQGRIDDWIHANSVNYDSRGDFYLTSRDVPGLWKIDGSSWEVVYHVASPANLGDVTMEQRYYADGLHSAYPLAPDRVLVLDNGKLTNVTRALVYNVNPATKTGTVDMEVVFPNAYHSKLGSNAKIIGENLMIYGARNANTVVFTDLNANVLRTLAVPYPIHRAEYIGQIKY